MLGTGSRARCAGVRAHRCRQDGGWGVRGPSRARSWPQVLLHHPDQGAEQSEAHRSGAPLRPGQDRIAHRRRVDQSGRTRGGDDHRGAAQHAVRGFRCAGGPFVCGDGRGALSRRPDARRGVGRSHLAPARRGAPGEPVRNGLQRRRVRRVDPNGARRHDRRRRRAAARPANAAHDGRQAAVRPLRRLQPGQSGVVAPHRQPAGGRQVARRATRPCPWFAATILSDAEPLRRGLGARPQRVAACDRVRLLPRGLRRRGGPVPAVGTAADRRRGTRSDRRSHRPAHRGPVRRRPGGAGLPRMAGRTAARGRRPPRRNAADLPAHRRGVVHRGPDQGRLCD